MEYTITYFKDAGKGKIYPIFAGQRDISTKKELLEWIDDFLERPDVIEMRIGKMEE
jgi:hypothetical protein